MNHSSKAYRPQRLYTAHHMAEGVKTVAALQQHVLTQKPESIGPLAALAPQPAPAGAEPVETAEGHCLTCKGKKTFTVEKSDVMKNGAIRKSGKSDCGHTISHFVSGAADAA